MTSQPAKPAPLLPLVMQHSATMAGPMLPLPPSPHIMLWGRGAMPLMWMNLGPAHCVVHASTECGECLFPLPLLRQQHGITQKFRGHIQLVPYMHVHDVVSFTVVKELLFHDLVKPLFGKYVIFCSCPHLQLCHQTDKHAYILWLKRMCCFVDRGPRDGPVSRNVRLCNNTVCSRTCWNRDVNAAINLLRLFRSWQMGQPRPPEFCR